MKWKSIVRLKFQIECVEGLRIGGSGGGLEIGELIDANLAAIRDPASGEPYIPGSSLKGKLRSVLEKKLGLGHGGEPCGCGKKDCMVCAVFGAHKNTRAESAPTRIVFRDAHMSEDSRKDFRQRQKEGQPTFEVKTENTINRKTGAAVNPRTGERVLPGTDFEGEILLHIYEGDDAGGLEDFVRQGLAIIQEGSSIGASGSRGYGKVRFQKVLRETLDLEKLKL